MSKAFKRYGWENIFFLFSLRKVFVDLPVIEPQSLIFAYAVIAGFGLLTILPLRLSSPLSLILWTLWISLMNSSGPISHSEHGYFLVSLGCTLAWLFNDKNKDAALEFSLAGCTYIYTASGLWKLFALTGEEHFFQAAAQNLPQHIAYGLAENFRDPGRIFLDYFYHHPMASAALWCLIIVTQIFVPLGVIFFVRGRIVFLLILIAFHLGAQWIVGPAFTAQIYLLMMFIGILLYRHFRQPADRRASI